MRQDGEGDSLGDPLQIAKSDLPCRLVWEHKSASTFLPWSLSLSHSITTTFARHAFFCFVLSLSLSPYLSRALHLLMWVLAGHVRALLRWQ